MGIGEFELIRRFFASRFTGADANDGVVLGIGDDAALLRVPPGCELAAAVDTIVAGRHFLPGARAHAIGYRSLAVNLSDLAAMGAKPAWATLALTIPRADEDWLEEFSRGFCELASRFEVALVGGDTTAGPLTVSVQLMGYVPNGTALQRQGASPGDLLVVSGTLGDAAAGLELARERGTPHETIKKFERELLHRFEYPEPRVALGQAARGVASAAMDISDGLAGDLPKLVAACGCAASVDVERLPLSNAILQALPREPALRCALSGGDDYELLLAVPETRFADLENRAFALGLKTTAIGRLAAGSGVHWHFEGREYTPQSQGFDHFR